MATDIHLLADATGQVDAAVVAYSNSLTPPAVNVLAAQLANALKVARPRVRDMTVGTDAAMHRQLKKFVERARVAVQLLVDAAGDESWDVSPDTLALQLIDLLDATVAVKDHTDSMQRGHAGSIGADMTWLRVALPDLRANFTKYCDEVDALLLRVAPNAP